MKISQINTNSQAKNTRFGSFIPELNANNRYNITHKIIDNLRFDRLVNEVAKYDKNNNIIEYMCTSGKEIQAEIIISRCDDSKLRSESYQKLKAFFWKNAKPVKLADLEGKSSKEIREMVQVDNPKLIAFLRKMQFNYAKKKILLDSTKKDYMEKKGSLDAIVNNIENAIKKVLEIDEYERQMDLIDNLRKHS